MLTPVTKPEVSTLALALLVLHTPPVLSFEILNELPLQIEVSPATTLLLSMVGNP